MPRTLKPDSPTNDQRSTPATDTLTPAARLARPNMEESLKDFLATPLFFYSKVRDDERETAIELLRSFTYYHGHKSLEPTEQELYEEYFRKAPPEHRGYHEIFGPAKFPQLLPDFFTFLTYEITPVASQKFVLATCMTMEELALWLIKHGHLGAEEGEEAAYRSAEAGRDLPRAMRALKRLHSEAQAESREEIRWINEGESENYKIARLSSNMLWLDSVDGERVGPIKISDKIKRDLEVGWEMHCCLVKVQGSWKIIGLGGIFPRPG